MTKIFINFHTADEPYGAALLDQELSRHFGPEMVFRASRSIPAGADFEHEIMNAVRTSDVLLAVIGPNWLTATDADGGVRLEDPRDFVRREIAPGTLPADIAGLARALVPGQAPPPDPGPAPVKANLNGHVTVRRDFIIN